ncbi:beta-N-acetylhexosaminidase [Phenylobacterium sp. SCN 70-31]|uniref:beta-N-acetylhexosaminidase n=1 Tax=Phenylobacterium sp. SCN 70-31 TaxID=1660129 RepID=UPI00086B0C42|nr:beta-N-acetylhexosaminidase [Phenylobacterium sp. SCN 70-31]ODT87087.1 MAG: beta-hexosaminidase [Phenylobacterium sp. SCN 70-31]
MTVGACILGCSGTVLTRDERAFFAEAQPWGFILFARNIGAPDQVRALTGALREAVARADAPILVDQEGGRVQRLGPPHWPRRPAAGDFARLRDLASTPDLVRLGARLLAHDLAAVGIDVNCLPVLDTPDPGAHRVIGDRAYGGDPDVVAVLGRAAAEGLIAGGVLPVVKHIPGHGRARADSHEVLPVVEASLDELAARDFVPFRALSDMPLAMTAHVRFAALDRRRPATLSRRTIRAAVRGAIGFDGLLISDDIGMKALSGPLEARARAARVAGCDVVLHGAGDLGGMREVAAGAGRLGGASARRARAALARRPRAPEPFDARESQARFDAAFGGRFAA